MPTPRTPYRTMLFRALRLRCPRCGKSKLFRAWFSMFPECSACGLSYDREPGFYLGSIYVNYGLTAVMTTILYFVGFNYGVPDNWLLAGLAVFCVVFPLLLFRHARAIWLAFDQFWDPQQTPEVEVPNAESESAAESRETP